MQVRDDSSDPRVIRRVQPNWLSLAQSVMRKLVLEGVVIRLSTDFVLPTAPTNWAPNGQRVAYDPESRLAKRTKVSNANKAGRKEKKRVARNFFGSPSMPWNQPEAEAGAVADTEAKAAHAWA